MQSRSPISRRVSLLLAALITIFANSIVNAQETSYKASFSQNKETIAVNVLVGQSRVINFDRPVGRFSVSNPEIAEAVLVTPDQVLVNGKAFGQVNFIAWEQTGGQFLVFDVYVRANLSLIDSHAQDRKSTRLNSSHVENSYAVFCLKKKRSVKDSHAQDRKSTRLNSSHVEIAYAV